MKTNVSTPNRLAVTWGLTKYALKASFRNKASYFFSLVFPLVFVSVFGLMGNNGDTIKFGVADTLDKNGPIYQAIEELSNQKDAPIELVHGNLTELEEDLKQDDLASVLAPAESGSNAEFKLITSNGSPQGKAAAESFINGIISQMNLAILQMNTGSFSLPFMIQNEEISGTTFRYIDFLLPGQIGFSMLSLATFGVGFTFIALRKTLVLKRMFATTVKPFDFVVSQALSRSLQAILQAAVIIAVGYLAFDFTLMHGWVSGFNMLVLSFLGILSFLGFGILISNLAKDENTLPIVLNLFNLPQMLLAGVFFPIDGMPQWVQAIGNNLPLAYLNSALRDVSIEGASLIDTWPYILGMLGWALVSYILASLTFKTE